jgi:hypothetical protein
LPKNVKASKQTTLDRLPDTPKKGPTKSSKQIIITQIDANIGENDLALKVAFKLEPSKAAFSKVQSDLSFNSHPINSVVIRIPHGPLATDECEYDCVLDMNGIAAGTYNLKVEMFEQWQSGERLCETTKELTVDYVPQTRQSRLVKIPTVKTLAGADLAVESRTEKDIYEEIGKTQKKEQLSKRDNW